MVGNTPLAINPVSAYLKGRKKKQEQEAAAAKATQKIPLPQVTPPQITEAPISTAPEVFKNTSGELSGVTLDGKTYLGLSPQDVKQIVEHQQAQTTIPQGAVSAGQAADLRRQQQAGLAQIQNVGQLTPEQQNLDVVKGEGIVGQAATLGGGIVGGLAGAKYGAAAGTFIAPGLGTAIGAAAGGLGGFVGGAFTKISYSKRQDVKQANKVYLTSKSNINWIINQVNAGKLDSITAVQMFNDEKANIYSAEKNLKQDTDSNLDRFLSGGADEQASVESYIRLLPEVENMLRIAMIKPNPNLIINEPAILE